MCACVILAVRTVRVPQQSKHTAYISTKPGWPSSCPRKNANPNPRACARPSIIIANAERVATSRIATRLTLNAAATAARIPTQRQRWCITSALCFAMSSPPPPALFDATLIIAYTPQRARSTRQNAEARYNAQNNITHLHLQTFIHEHSLN